MDKPQIEKDDDKDVEEKKKKKVQERKKRIMKNKADHQLVQYRPMNRQGDLGQFEIPQFLQLFLMRQLRQTVPVVRELMPQHRFLLFGDIPLDLDYFIRKMKIRRVEDGSGVLEQFRPIRRSAKYTDRIEFEFDCSHNGLTDFQYIIEALKSMGNDKGQGGESAQHFAGVLDEYQKQVRQIVGRNEYFKKCMQQKAVSIDLESRMAASLLKAEEILSQLNGEEEIFIYSIISKRFDGLSTLRRGFSSGLIKNLGVSEEEFAKSVKNRNIFHSMLGQVNHVSIMYAQQKMEENPYVRLRAHEEKKLIHPDIVHHHSHQFQNILRSLLKEVLTKQDVIEQFLELPHPGKEFYSGYTEYLPNPLPSFAQYQKFIKNINLHPSKHKFPPQKQIELFQNITQVLTKKHPKLLTNFNPENQQIPPNQSQNQPDISDSRLHTYSLTQLNNQLPNELQQYSQQFSSSHQNNNLLENDRCEMEESQSNEQIQSAENLKDQFFDNSSPQHEENSLWEDYAHISQSLLNQIEADSQILPSQIAQWEHATTLLDKLHSKAQQDLQNQQNQAEAEQSLFYNSRSFKPFQSNCDIELDHQNPIKSNKKSSFDFNNSPFVTQFENNDNPFNQSQLGIKTNTFRKTSCDANNFRSSLSINDSQLCGRNPSDNFDFSLNGDNRFGSTGNASDLFEINTNRPDSFRMSNETNPLTPNLFEHNETNYIQHNPYGSAHFLRTSAQEKPAPFSFESNINELNGYFANQRASVFSQDQCKSIPSEGHNRGLGVPEDIQELEVNQTSNNPGNPVKENKIKDFYEQLLQYIGNDEEEDDGLFPFPHINSTFKEDVIREYEQIRSMLEDGSYMHPQEFEKFIEDIRKSPRIKKKQYLKYLMKIPDLNDYSKKEQKRRKEKEKRIQLLNSTSQIKSSTTQQQQYQPQIPLNSDKSNHMSSVLLGVDSNEIKGAKEFPNPSALVDLVGEYFKSDCFSDQQVLLNSIKSTLQEVIQKGVLNRKAADLLKETENSKKKMTNGIHSLDGQQHTNPKQFPKVSKDKHHHQRQNEVIKKVYELNTNLCQDPEVHINDYLEVFYIAKTKLWKNFSKDLILSNQYNALETDLENLSQNPLLQKYYPHLLIQEKEEHQQELNQHKLDENPTKKNSFDMVSEDTQAGGQTILSSSDLKQGMNKKLFQRIINQFKMGPPHPFKVLLTIKKALQKIIIHIPTPTISQLFLKNVLKMMVFLLQGDTENYIRCRQRVPSHAIETIEKKVMKLCQIPFV